jgi:hypothetical protein
MSDLAVKPTIILQERDRALLRGLFDSRLATLVQLADLHFNGSREYAKKRVQKLKLAGLVKERPRAVNEPSKIVLTLEGIRLLKAEGSLAELPAMSAKTLTRRTEIAESTTHHEVQVMDVKAAFHRAIEATDHLTLKEFSTWPKLHKFTARQSGYPRKEQTIHPDGFIRIEESTARTIYEHTFYFELDRGTETVETTLANKAGCYLDYYRSGGFAEKNGAPPTEFRDYPFRVLFVCKTFERCKNICLALLKLTPPVLTHSWFTTLEEAKRDPLGAIWMQPEQFRGGANTKIAGARTHAERRVVLIGDR